MSRAAHHFVTPLSVSAISGERVFQNLFDVGDEHDVGHIRLARETDLIVVAPATADLLAKMAHGLADDLASAILLATDKPVIAAPAMNPKMWEPAATQRNVAQLRKDGVLFVGPATGEMAESGEAGIGRLAEPADILAAIEEHFSVNRGPLAGTPRHRHVRADAGADRSGALSRQPLLGPAGPCHRRSARGGGRGGDAGQRAGGGSAAGRRVRSSRSAPRGRCRRRWRKRFPPTSR